MYKELDRKMFNRLDFDMEFAAVDYKIIGNKIKIEYTVWFDNRLKEIEYMDMTVPVDDVLSSLSMNEPDDEDRDMMIREDLDIYIKRMGHEYSKNLKKRLNIDQLFTSNL